jgi:hypothetical protein
MSTILKTLVAGLATATVALAFAQGTPPNPAAANPATGAGQRSSQNTPMGTTGTPTGGGAAAQGTTAGSSAATSAATSANTSAGSSGTMASDNMGSKSTTKHKRAKHHKVAKADRG